MFPGPNTLHVFKPRSIYKATGGGILEKFGKSAIKTVKKIIKKKTVKKPGKGGAKKHTSKKKQQKSASKKK